MREADNIRAVSELGVDWIGLIFWPQSPRYVSMIPSGAGIVPDRSSLSEPTQAIRKGKDVNRQGPKRVGVFVDATAQDIITRVYSFGLDIVQLHGRESPTLIRNLRRTLGEGIKMMKAISVGSREEVAAYKPYADCVDYFLFDTKSTTVGGSGRHFDWTLLQAYDGSVPFLLSGGISPDDAPRLREAFSGDNGSAAIHPQCIGIDLNSRFETAPGLKDVAVLQLFLSQLSH